ncbi:MAG: rRNA maturation RNase YbeY [bacterium]
MDKTMDVITVSIVSDSEMKKLNKKYRGKEYPTDVLSFNLNEKLPDGGFCLGEVIVNKAQAKRQAKDYGNSFEEEIADLVGHGVLHLMGVHHKE